MSVEKRYFTCTEYKNGVNINKYYEVVFDEDAGVLRTEYGRVDHTKTVNEPTPPTRAKFKSICRDRIKHGYTDISESYYSAESNISAKASSGLTVPDQNSETSVDNLLLVLKAYAENVVSLNYNVKAGSVNIKQINLAREYIEELWVCENRLKTVITEFSAGNLTLSAAKSQLNVFADTFNAILTEKLFRILPRKMRSVTDYVYTYRVPSDAGLTYFNSQLDKVDQLITFEESILEAMKSLVTASALDTVQVPYKSVREMHSHLAASLGVEVSEPSESELNQVKKWLGRNVSYLRNVYVVRNKATLQAFYQYVKKNFGEDQTAANLQCLWHGSRSENWLSIITSGLLLNPSPKVRRTGSMFGHGIYFADSSRKSFGYTSGRGSKWAKGTSNRSFLALFDVALGQQIHTKGSEWVKYHNFTPALMQSTGYHSLFAHATPNESGGLQMNEFIIFNQAACTMHFLIELGC